MFDFNGPITVTGPIIIVSSNMSDEEVVRLVELLEEAMSRVTDEVDAIVEAAKKITTVRQSVRTVVGRLVALVKSTAGDETKLREGLAAIEAEVNELADAAAEGTAAADEAEAEPTE